jgi:hypothetical protein
LLSSKRWRKKNRKERDVEVIKFFFGLEREVGRVKRMGGEAYILVE